VHPNSSNDGIKGGVGHEPHGWLRRWRVVGLEVESVEAAGHGALAGRRGDRGRGRRRGAAPVVGGAAPGAGGRGIGRPAGGPGAGDHRGRGSSGIGAEAEGRNPSDATRSGREWMLEGRREERQKGRARGRARRNGLDKFLLLF